MRGHARPCAGHPRPYSRQVRRGWPGRSPAMTGLSSNPFNFIIIEITVISTPNVSSPATRRNNSPAHETIFRLACRRPETFADYHFAQRSAAKAAHGERVMQNVIAINAAARQGIIAAQATSDQMLLESIADGART